MSTKAYFFSLTLLFAVGTIVGQLGASTPAELANFAEVSESVTAPLHK